YAVPAAEFREKDLRSSVLIRPRTRWRLLRAIILARVVVVEGHGCCGATMCASAKAEGAPAKGVFAPLRHAVFRRIWTASLLSNLGLLIMGVGAAWAMTQMTSSADKVALVQTALMLPLALLSTVAGAVADMFDRRIVGLTALVISLAGSMCLTLFAWLGLLTPALLLVFCFMVG